MKQSNYDKFLAGYSGRELLKKHPDLTVIGIWEVRGEDPNCDMGGTHHQPYLGTFTGELRDVIFMAVDLPGFWNWGAGGDIKAVEIQAVKDVATQKARRELVIEKRKLITKLEQEIKSLGHVA